MLYSSVLTIFQYNAIGKLLILFQNKYQPIVAMLIPVIKEINTRINNKYIMRASNGDVTGTIIIGKYSIITKHTLMLCYIMGSIATNATTWLLMAIDFSYNIYTCLRIVWMKRNHPLDVEIHIKLLQNLALNELIELMVPLSFIATLVIAYFGPNSELIGNIGSSLWHYKKVEDINQALENVLMVFFMDLSSIMFGSIILWIACGIIFFKAIMAIVKEFGFVMFLTLGYYLMSVRRNIFTDTILIFSSFVL